MLNWNIDPYDRDNTVGFTVAESAYINETMGANVILNISPNLHEVYKTVDQQVALTLYAALGYCPRLYSTKMGSLHSPTSIMLDFVRRISMQEYVPETQINIRLYTITRNITDTFSELDANLTEEKYISIGLMRDRYHKIRTYINKEQRVLILVSNRDIDNEMVRKILAIAPAVLNMPAKQEAIGPAYSAEAVQKILAHLVDADGTEFFKEFKAWLKLLNIEEVQKRQMLAQAFADLQRAEGSEIDSLVSHARENVRACEQHLKETLATFEQAIKQQYAYLYTKDQSDSKYSEWIEYLVKHNSLKKIFYNDNSDIGMIITVPLLYWDPKAFDKLKNNNMSGFNCYKDKAAQAYADTYAAEALDSIFEDIFRTQRLTLYFCNNIKLSLTTGTVGDMHSVSNSSLLGGIPNPHLRYYNCWGSNAPEIRRYVQQGDYIMAFQQICTAMSGINLLDSTVINRWLRHIYTEPYAVMGSCKCLRDAENPDRLYSFLELVQLRCDEIRRIKKAEEAAQSVKCKVTPDTATVYTDAEPAPVIDIINELDDIIVNEDGDDEINENLFG